MPNNPLAASADPNARRIIAHGLRNPFRFTIRPGTNEVWIGDVGWNNWEEINRVADPLGSVENFGWPCYEGHGRNRLRQREPDHLREPLCARRRRSSRRTTRTTTAPSRPRRDMPDGKLLHRRRCLLPGRSATRAYDGALFFADYSRDCIWVMFPGATASPIRATVRRSGRPPRIPVDLQIGPDGELYYVDFDGGTIRRIAYLARISRRSPSATGSPTNGHGAADGQLRRKRLERPRGRDADLLVGSQRRRYIRRLHRGGADAHIHPSRDL